MPPPFLALLLRSCQRLMPLLVVLKVLRQAGAAAPPLLVVAHTPAPHRPAQPAPQHMESFSSRGKKRH